MPTSPKRPTAQPANRRSAPPDFTPVKLRARRDGWGADVQCAFLAALYCTGSVAAAAQHVGRSRASAYALRKHRFAQSFADAWDHIMAGPPGRLRYAGDAPVRRAKVADWRKLTLRDLMWRHQTGLWRPVVYRGKMRAIARKPDNSALLRLLRRLDTKASAASEEGW